MYAWGDERRFNSYNSYFTREFGGRVQKISIDAGFSCPNRDGTISTGGCTFCRNDAFNPSYCRPEKSIRRQIEEGIEFHQRRYRRAKSYLAYFQPYTNTHKPVEELENLYREALSVEGIIGIVIGTRPDCISEEILEMLSELREKCEVSRGESEVSRVESEVSRGESEVSRVESEVLRGESEVLRVESDVLRGVSEVLRVESEVLRGESEVSRGESEVSRGESEVLRVESEVLRVESEVSRVESEVEKPVIIIEYGIESVYDETLKRVNRGHDFAAARRAVELTHNYGFPCGGHFIFGLPGETRDMMIHAADLISELPLTTVKFHQLQIFKDTVMAEDYISNPDDFHLFTLEEYIEFVIDFIERLNPDIVIERFAGEVPPRFLVSKPWESLRYDQVLAMIERRMEERDTWQGRNYVY